jgi:hypothetical protein
MSMATQPQKASPLLWGTNLSLQDTNDQVLNSGTTRALLQQMHLHIIRIPTRSNMADSTIQHAAQIVHDLGATPSFFRETYQAPMR